MLRRRRDRMEDADDDVIVEKGPSLAKGPNLIIGTILVAYGLSGLLRTAGHQFPSFSSNFPDADVTGSSWLGPEINGWTVWLCIAAGALLLFGAAQHHLAKIMSLIVGLALGAAAIIALIDGDVLGLAAANGWTELGWGIASAILLLNVFSPRRTRERPVGRGTAAPAGAGTAVPTYARDRDRLTDDDRDRLPADRDRLTDDDRDRIAADRERLAADDRDRGTSDDRTTVAPPAAATPETAAEHRDERFGREDGTTSEADGPGAVSSRRDDRI
jgi:hypothetical protein